MQKTEYTIEVEKDRHGYVAVCREMDIASEGPTSEAAMANLKEILDLLPGNAEANGSPQCSKARQLAGALSKLDDLKAIALELFDSVRFQVEVDPEIDDTYNLVLSLTAAGQPREVVARQLEWHRRANPILQEDCIQVQLVIDIRE
jgi:predicted RNase H-like HicB family nuclease